MSYEQPTPEELAQDLLSRMMCDISEDCFCAGWMNELEYDLWEALESGNRSYGMCEIRERDMARLKRLHELAGGWWIFPVGGDLHFVTTQEWLSIYAEGRPEPKVWLLTPDDLRRSFQ
jgi:hypothetical protein